MASAALENNSAEGVDVQQRGYTNDNVYSDEWDIYFDSCVFLYTGIDESSDDQPEKIENLTRNIIQKSAYVFSYQQMNKQTFLSELQQHDIFYCVVHGRYV
ncbi:MAG: hypothetical protein E7385_07005 [Ruminococcaceae bacterium]|nr:hypothetical protein [Oscillospiraceae bacterium]